MSKKKASKPRVKKVSGLVSSEELERGTPKNGFVVLFRLFTKREHDELVKLKESVPLPDGVRRNWPNVVVEAMRRAAA